MVDALHYFAGAPTIREAEKSSDFTILVSVGLGLLAVGLIIAILASGNSNGFDPSNIAPSLL
jgi:hypothetical protein